MFVTVAPAMILVTCELRIVVPTAGPPESVRLPDGIVQPFEPERITRSLFAATEWLGHGDAFLARELTDGVLHFLSMQESGPVTTPDEIAEIVSKVVRELGHPALASEYERRDAAPDLPPQPSQKIVGSTWPARSWPELSPAAVIRTAAAKSLEALSLCHVYSADLVSAHREQLLTLGGLETPLELAGVIVAPARGQILVAMRSAREIAGEFVAIDGPEYDLAAEQGTAHLITANYLEELRLAADVTGLRVILNLNVSSPPRIGDASGPLFQSPGTAPQDRRQEMAGELADLAGESCFSLWWHVAPDSARPEQLNRPVQLAQEGRDIEFVFDHPGGLTSLGPGLDRQTPATLLIVGANLARLVEMIGGPPIEPATFLTKVASLARFAKTAGHVKQDFLRRYGRPGLRQGFLLDRARLVIVPVGIADAARATDRTPSEFAAQIVKTIRLAAENDRPRQLPIRVDAPLDETGWEAVGEPGLSFRHQIRSAVTSHSVAGAGRLVLQPEPGGRALAAGVEAVRQAAQSGIRRLRFASSGNPVEGGPQSNLGPIS
jgi:hypothetical protein